MCRCWTWLKALHWREALIQRGAELAKASLQLSDDSKYVSACILTRSLMETVGMLFWMQKRIGKVIKEEALGDIDIFLTEGLVGESERD